MSVRRLAPKEVQPASFTFTPENLEWAKKQIAKYPEGRQASAVIAILWRVQEQHEGWVSEAAIRAVADLLDMAYIRVLEVATFYTMFQLQPVGKKAHVQVCGTTPCRLRGAGDLIEVCQSRIHHDPFELSKDGNFSWEEVECLGACVNAPMVLIWSDTYEDLTKENFGKVLDDFASGKPLKLIVYDPRSNRLETVTELSILDRIKVSTNVGYNVFGTSSAFWLERIAALNASAARRMQ